MILRRRTVLEEVSNDIKTTVFVGTTIFSGILTGVAMLYRLFHVGRISQESCTFGEGPSSAEK